MRHFTAFALFAALALAALPAPAPCQGFEHLIAAKSPQCAAYTRPARGAVPLTMDAARCRFVEFAGRWLGTIGRNLRHTKADMQVVPDGAGFVARFVRLDPEGATFSIKPSGSGSSPFVGVLRYEEHHYEARGGTRDAAAAGPFSRVRRMRVTEIFRFVSGRWVN